MRYSLACHTAIALLPPLGPGDANIPAEREQEKESATFIVLEKMESKECATLHLHFTPLTDLHCAGYKWAPESAALDHVSGPSPGSAAVASILRAAGGAGSPALVRSLPWEVRGADSGERSHQEKAGEFGFGVRECGQRGEVLLARILIDLIMEHSRWLCSQMVGRGFGQHEAWSTEEKILLLFNKKIMLPTSILDSSSEELVSLPDPYLPMLLFDILWDCELIILSKNLAGSLPCSLNAMSVALSATGTIRNAGEAAREKRRTGWSYGKTIMALRALCCRMMERPRQQRRPCWQEYTTEPHAQQWMEGLLWWAPVSASCTEHSAGPGTK
ncbi:hypothetical protein JZ751_026750 [Albula glossodonta]|uniref:Uncharacterized protein n=1 Tax=Albula glossodonta TaxID=121402 RepID=A0A8T2PGV0_9TELE|nr:hypothetical protein JZ751_026750 [Albula glossodonta]